MKHLLTALFLFIASAPVFANITTVKPKDIILLQSFAWEYNSPDDGRFFLLGPDSPNKLVISVNATLKNGLPADSITVVNCNGEKVRVEPNQEIVCYGNFRDVIYMEVPATSFKNGSAGLFTFKPLS